MFKRNINKYKMGNNLGFFQKVALGIFALSLSYVTLDKINNNFATIDTSVNQASVSTYKNINYDSNQICDITEEYPLEIMQWCEIITEQANNNGLESNLIAALILQESGGNPDAYSVDGAVGLMQVMPKDGLAAEFMCLNGPCFADRPSMEELYCPEFNIEYGTRFLARLVDRYNGDIREALRAYGPMNVEYYYADIVLNLKESYEN